MPTDFRPNYRELTPSDKTAMTVIKTAAASLAQQINDRCPIGREQSLALTKLEECVMWAVKGITG